MDDPELQDALATRLLAGAIYVTGATLITALILKQPEAFVGAPLLIVAPAFLGPAVLAFAGAIVFSRPRLAFASALIGGLLVLPWFIWTESLFESSWVSLNLPVDATPEEHDIQTFVKAKLFSAGIIAMAICYSSLRLLPARLTLGGSPLRVRTWLAFAIGILVMAAWFASTVSPYRVPIIADSVRFELRILHVEKRGLEFHETVALVGHDRRLYLWRYDRRLFQYAFYANVAEGLVENRIWQDLQTLLYASQISAMRTQPARALRSWTAQGWYLVLRDSRLLAFSSEDNTLPPKAVTDLFRKIEKVPVTETGLIRIQDICLGFCYGPVAALGFWYPNQPCFVLTRGTTECR